MEDSINLDLTSKTALVCGASQGIGAAVAEAFAEQGCTLIAMARSKDKLETLLAGMRGGPHHLLAQDISDRAGLQKAVSSLLETHGPIQILVNNTAGPKPGPASEADEASFLAGFENHVLASSLLQRLLLPGMRRAAYGRIINIISTSVKIPIPNLGVSNTIRGAMANWSKTLASELGPLGITVNNILPGFTRTPRLESLIENAAKKTGQSREAVIAAWKTSIPARRFAEPGEVAAAAAFLASPAAAYINGINLPVDGGRTGCL